MHIILAGIQRRNKLSDYQGCRVAGIVMHVFQSRVDDFLAGIFKKFRMISVRIKKRRQHFQMPRKHGRNQDPVILLHLFRKFYSALFIHFVSPGLSFPVLRVTSGDEY